MPGIEALQPPPEIKTIIDKTASFVARLGQDFEGRIHQNEKDNPKFSFLMPNQPFHGYYKKRIEEFRQEFGGGKPAEATSTPTVTTPTPESVPSQEQVAQPLPASTGVVQAEAAPTKYGPTSLAQRILAVSRKLKALTTQEQQQLQTATLAPDLFVLTFPSDLTPADLDIMKLTAQFVARNGHQFHVGLQNREHKNAQFDFLKQGHPHHNFFLQLVESYTRCLLPPKNITEKLRETFSDRQALLDKLVQKYLVEKQLEEQKKAAENELSRESAEALIDWHDFVVVETIDFNDEEELAPQPEQQHLLPMPAAALPTASYGPAGAPLPTAEQEKVQDVEMEMDMEMETEEDEIVQKPPAEIKVRKDYVKGSSRVGDVVATIQYSKCPKCGQDIPIDEMAEHMRIELLDPKYREQRQQQEREKAKAAASMVGRGDEISRNLSAFAKRRTDIFGDDEEVEIGKTVNPADAEREYKKKDEDQIWDGHTGSIPRATNSVAAAAAAAAAAIQAAKLAAATPSSSDKPEIGPEAPIKSAPSIKPPVISPALIQQQQQRLAAAVHAHPGGAGLIPPPPGLHGLGVPPGVIPPPPPGISSFHSPAVPPPPGGSFGSGGSTSISNEDEASLKRKKAEEVQLIPEDEFLQKFGTGPIRIRVQVPNEEGNKSEWKLNGQVLQLSVSLTDTVASLKERLKDETGLPVNKQKLKVASANNLAITKDQQSFASYNVFDQALITLEVKRSGGKKRAKK